MPPQPIFRGDFINHLQWETFDFDPQRGFIYRAEFRGIGQVAMLALQAQYVAAGIANRLTERFDVFTMEAEDATQAYTIDTWQIVGDEESRDGLSHPLLYNSLVALSLDAYKIIASARAHLEANDDPTALFASGGDFYGSPAILQKFYDLQVRGEDGYFHDRYVLRHTTNAPNRWSVNVSDVGIDQIYTTSQLLTEVQDGTQWIFPLPGRLAYKIGAIPAPTFQTDYLWGWLKRGSTETSAANNRVDITTEYKLEQWPSGTYYQPKP